jgi:hypothetical protein
MLLSYNNCCYLLRRYVCVPQQAASCLNVLLPAPPSILCGSFGSFALFSRTPAFLSVPEQQITLGWGLGVRQEGGAFVWLLGWFRREERMAANRGLGFASQILPGSKVSSIVGYCGGARGSSPWAARCDTSLSQLPAGVARASSPKPSCLSGCVPRAGMACGPSGTSRM